MNNLALGESLELLVDHRGKTPKKLNTDFTLSGVPVASAIMVKDGRLNLYGARCVDQETYVRWMGKPMRKGDVLLTSEAPLGRVARVLDNSPLVLGQRLFGLRGQQGILNTDFLYYALQTEQVQSDLRGRSSGSTVSGIRQSALKEIFIPSPAYADQTRIAGTLTALDNKIDLNQQVANSVERLAQELVGTILDTALLSEFVEVNRSLVAPSDFGSAPVWHYSLPSYDARRMPEHVLSNKIQSSKFRLQHPGVLISKLNPRFPRVWNVSNLRSGASFTSTEFVILEPKIGTPEFLWGVLSQPAFGAALETKAAGTSGSHQRVRPNDLLRTPAIDARMASPHLMAAVTQTVRLADHCREENATLAALRDTLLPELMSGRLKVRDAEEQAGEVL